MRLEHSELGYQLRVYDSDSDSYIATCNVQKYMDVGIVTSMLGTRLFITILESSEALYRDTGIRYLCGYVLVNIAEAIKRLFKDRPDAYTTGRTYTDEHDRDFIWVEVDLLSED